MLLRNGSGKISEPNQSIAHLSILADGNGEANCSGVFVPPYFIIAMIPKRPFGTLDPITSLIETEATLMKIYNSQQRQALSVNIIKD